MIIIILSLTRKKKQTAVINILSLILYISYILMSKARKLLTKGESLAATVKNTFITFV